MMEGYVATIGMFDGVHLGHQFVLRQVVKQVDLEHKTMEVELPAGLEDEA